MANDIDLWGDIETLEDLGKQQEADELHKIFVAWYIEETTKDEKFKLETKFRHNFGYFPKI